jgi:hypothetical protein
MKLGYTFYPKDWNTSEAVFELSLEERGFYRELIDLAMLNDNKTQIKLSVWARKFASDINTLESILDVLEVLKLIKRDDLGKTLFIPSCEPRLNLVRGGRKGGKSKPTPKPIVKPTPKPTPKQKKINIKEKKDNIGVEKKFLNWFNIQKKKFTNRKGNFKGLSKTDFNNLKTLMKDYNQDDFNNAIPSLFSNEWAKETNNLTPTHFLRLDNFNKYLNQDNSIAPQPKKESLYD